MIAKNDVIYILTLILGILTTVAGTSGISAQLGPHGQTILFWLGLVIAVVSQVIRVINVPAVASNSGTPTPSSTLIGKS